MSPTTSFPTVKALHPNLGPTLFTTGTIAHRTPEKNFLNLPHLSHSVLQTQLGFLQPDWQNTSCSERLTTLDYTDKALCDVGVLLELDRTDTLQEYTAGFIYLETCLK